jgi:hypothetical protein
MLRSIHEETSMCPSYYGDIGKKVIVPVGVFVGVGVLLGVNDAVSVGEGVKVYEGVKLGVMDGVKLGDTKIVTVLDGDGVNDGVSVSVGVGVGVSVTVAVRISGLDVRISSGCVAVRAKVGLRVVAGEESGASMTAIPPIQ